MLRKLLAKDRHFSLGNVWKYLTLNRLSNSFSFTMLVHKYNFLLQILLKLMHTSPDFIATKTCRSCEFVVVCGQLRVKTEKVRCGLRPKKCGGVYGAGRVRVGSVRARIPAGAGLV